MLENPTIPTPKILSATPPLLKTNLASLIPVVLVAVAFLSIYQQSPPTAGTTSTSQIEFSSARAMTYVEGIGKDPHPSGSFPMPSTYVIARAEENSICEVLVVPA